MSWQWLLTAFALFGAGYACYFAWRAGQSAERAAHSEHRLAIMRGQVAGLEISMTAMDDRLKRLNGKVAADAYWNGQRAEQPQLQPLDGACDNWRTAQREGPNSDAAKCQCQFCEAARATRSARRASLRSGVKT